MARSVGPGIVIVILALAGSSLSGKLYAHPGTPVAPRGSPRIVIAQEAVERLRNLFFADDFEGGRMEGEELVARFPESSELRAWHLLHEAQRWRDGDALRQSETLAVVRPSDPWSWFALAAALRFNHERHAESPKISRKALGMAGDHPDFLWLRAMVLENEQRPEDALEFVDRAIPKAFNPANLLVVRGDAIQSVGRRGNQAPDTIALDAALREYEKARRADPSCVHAYTRAAEVFAYQERRPRESLPLMEQALALAPCSLRVHQTFWNVMGRLPDRGEKQKQARI